MGLVMGRRCVGLCWVLWLLQLGVLAGCGQSGKDPGEFIAIAVEPRSVFVVGGKGFSCVDLSEPPAFRLPTVQPNRAQFSNFKLQWKSDDKLIVTMIRTSVNSPNLGGTYKSEISGAELDFLLGTSGGEISGKQTINSNDPDPQKKAVRCGIHLGGINIPEDARSFTATVQFDVYGYSVAADGAQAPVKQSTTSTIEYLQ